ncbi:MAG: glycosyltransferase family 2 protein [Deltaproteobacteria bacterium]|nr:glycosyltransferase family 2 protein [Deltaproteobacteria bacterium]MCL5277735.1 glycosyltransferase family 2 protein [Deltaproteobacteria bacterium]
MGVDLSVIIPVFNEAESVGKLYAELKDVIGLHHYDAEIVFVDDGSTDATLKNLKRIASDDRTVKVVSFRRNYGQTPAMSAGIENAGGRIIVTMDADLQNDPHDIPAMIALIESGYDLVSGWRKPRRDKFLVRTLPSMVANHIIGIVTGVRLHDFGCTLKAYKADILKGIKLYGEMHRFIPVYAAGMGASIAEIQTHHRPRHYGKTHYGFMKTIKVLLDLLTVKFLADFSTRPLHLFGGSGLMFMLASFFIGVYVLYEKFHLHVFAYRNPLLLLAVFLFLIGFELILIGLIAELIIRLYHESMSNPVYTIKEKINL